MERKNQITAGGNGLTLIGPELKVGDKAPEFSLLGTDSKPVKLSDSAGKVRLLSVVPSLDTSVCDVQTTTFNKRAADLGDDIVLYTISCDLPPAQKRYCTAREIDRLTTLSDHYDVSFGSAYGLLIKELRLLARAVIVIDKDDTISYFQLVPEIASEPDYDSALAALKDTVTA